MGKGNIESEYISMELQGIREVLNLLATEFDRMKKAKKDGRPIVGTWLNTPNEILLAADVYATTYRFEDLYSEIIKGRSELRKVYEVFNMDQCFCIDVCRSLGSPIIGAPRDYDLVVTDFTAKLPEWKDILQRYIAEKWNFLPLEIPRGLKKREALMLIMQRLEEIKGTLEKLTGKEISDDAIREACEKTNRIREYVAKLDELFKMNPMPVKGGDIWYAYFPMSASYIGGEVDRTYEALSSLYEEVLERVEQGVSAYNDGVKRLCAIPCGSNLTKDSYPIVEKSGSALVTDWPCCEHGGLLFREQIKLNGDPIKALAEHYLKTFGIFDPAQDAKDILEMVDRLDIDAVIYDVQPDLFGYAAPVLSVEEVKEVLTESGIPVFVHNGNDPTGIKSFLETC